ncbi:MAG: hypothetical protein M1829_003109 [Trizodia sp. TS-e1964]|nr:MAG: hypothetical protein M1829_003109 [Trizodia sp. TS-e1964]
MAFRSISLMSIFLGLASASCLHGTSLLPRQANADHAAISTFGYTALKGPLNWLELDPTKNAACSKGNRQSPINIDSSIKILPASDRPVLNYPDVKSAEFENLGSTVEIVAKGTMKLADGSVYNLAQFHFHTPSEHRINEEYYPVEVHFVHQGAADPTQIAVIAILLDIAPFVINPLIRDALQKVDAIREPGTITETGPLVFSSIIKHVQSHDVYSYSGSLTTPPCRENVTFLVSTRPLRINVDTYNRLKSVVKFNSRYTQNTLGSENLLTHQCGVLAKNSTSMR